MNDTTNPAWRRVRRNIRNRMVAGMFALVPIGITLLVMRWVLAWMAGFLRPLVEHLTYRLAAAFGIVNIRPELLKAPFMIISIVGFLAGVYAAGALAQAMVGRRLIRAGENALIKVPVAGTIYSAAKQVMDAFALPTQSALRNVVLVEFPRKGVWSVGFLTGAIRQTDGRELLKVFIPTTPNPTTGFFLILPSSDVIPTTLTVEDAFKMIISGGIVSPPDMDILLPTQTQPPPAPAPPTHDPSSG